MSGLLDAVESLPDRREGPHVATWTEEQDAALLAGWGKKRQRDVARIIGYSMNTCRERYRRLTGV